MTRGGARARKRNLPLLYLIYFPRINNLSRSAKLVSNQVGRPWLHWSARSVISISRSRAFIFPIKENESKVLTFYWSIWISFECDEIIGLHMMLIFWRSYFYGFYFFICFMFILNSVFFCFYERLRLENKINVVWIDRIYFIS